MEQTYLSRKREALAAPARAVSVPAVPSLDAPKMGAAQPTAELLGRPVVLPGAIRAKMEAAFGADLSAVKLYESQAVAVAGANAVAQGSRIAFAPGTLDFASASGPALLGHELSHVVSQARGEVAGSGFLNDAALEARADREGAMAAAGEQVYAGPVTTALSSASAAPAAGPMQASKSTSKGKKHYDRYEEAAFQRDAMGIYSNSWSEAKKKLYQKYTDQMASAQKWMKYWEPWITPEEANKQLRKHITRMTKLTGQASVLGRQMALNNPAFVSQLKHEQGWIDFLYSYANDESIVTNSRNLYTDADTGSQLAESEADNLGLADEAYDYYLTAFHNSRERAEKRRGRFYQKAARNPKNKEHSIILDFLGRLDS